jgi:type II secretory pathway pseudopilin PulG
MFNFNKNINILNRDSFKQKKTILGFSLIEILIYLSIFTVLSTLIINLFIVITSSFHFTHINRKLLEAGMVSMERISQEIRLSNEIDLTNSTIESLVLKSNNIAGGPVITQFKKEGNQLIINKDDTNNNSADIDDTSLLDEKVIVDSLIFNYINTGISQAVRIQLSLSYSSGNNTKTANFYNTIILRGSY